MRRLSGKEIKKRGCNYCNNSIRVKGCYEPVRGYQHGGLDCPYSECPYHELDKYDSYKDYLNSDDSKLNFPELKF